MVIDQQVEKSELAIHFKIEKIYKSFFFLTIEQKPGDDDQQVRRFE